MNHGKKLKKLNRTPAHRKSLLMNLAISLFKHERIKTTLAKAKALKPFAEKLITKSRNKNLHTIRKLASVISDKSVVKKLVDELGERFKKRPGGYTRIYKYGFRTNDGAPVALIELVDYSVRLKERESKTAGEKISQGTAGVKEKLISLVKSDKPQEDQKKIEGKETKKEEKKEPSEESKKAKVKKKVVAKKDSSPKTSK